MDELRWMGPSGVSWRGMGYRGRRVRAGGLLGGWCTLVLGVT